MGRSLAYPFVRVIGQDEMKLALILNVIDPKIGGVLIEGEKGTAKSTTVRALSQILPEVESSKGCPYHCDVNSSKKMCDDCLRKYRDGTLESERRQVRIVELPLNATEDRITGSLDIEYILQYGKKRFETGILAQANENILYVDEVNLLEDHIVDLLLDSAAMGRNYVEREGLSISHPSSFVLIGTMNPEEGLPRPQLVDRFGMSVNVTGEMDVKVRTRIIESRMSFEADPESFVDEAKGETEELCARITDAKSRVSQIPFDSDVATTIARITTSYGIVSHRADISMFRAARANAALNGRDSIFKKDIEAVAESILRHRLPRSGIKPVVFDGGILSKCLRALVSRCL